MSNTAHELTERLLNALDKNYNVVDMVAVNDVISVLENIKITKELLETTRLGKHVNELRRQSTDPTLARRAKLLVKKWRDLILPAGGKSQSSSSSQHTPTGSVDNTPYQSPLASRGYSPLAPMLTSPQVFPQTHNSSHKHGSLTPSSVNFKTSALPQQMHQNVRHRQPLTSPGHRNVPQIAKNPSVPFSPGLSKLASPLVSPVVSSHSRNASPTLKNLSPGVPQKISSNVNKNISPGSNFNRNAIPGVNSNRNSPSVLSRNSSPGVVNSNKIISPGVSSFKNISPTDRSLLIGQSANKTVNTAVKNLSPALRLPPESLTVKPSSNKRSEQYDSDSQDVIWVDDDEDMHKPVPVNPLTVNDRSNDGSRHSSKRPRSPVNGEQWKDDSEHSHRAAKKAKKETRGRKPKKRRNHKSENRTVDHSLDPVPSPLPPAINSSSTSPVLKNGLASLGSAPVHPPAFSIPVLVDDIDSRSPKPEPTVVKQRSSRKNGCKKNSLAMDDYSAFIKNKIPAAGKKVKTTQELLEDIQSRKLGSVSVDLEEKSSKPKEDFLTAYDNKKKETSVVPDIIELNDSNSSLKHEESSSSKKVDVKVETKDNDKENEPMKFEPVETILARLPPIDRSWMYTEEVLLTPPCTCTLIYTTPETEVKLPNTSPLHQPKKSIFEMDYEDTPKDIAVKEEAISSVVVPALPTFEEKIDPYCEAAVVHERIPSDIADPQVLALHNCFIPDVNGSTCDKKLQFGSKKKPICKMDYWGSKPYYDCSNQLFHSVVPKYNYLDYSLDRCVKNLTKVRLDKYEPVDVTIGTKDWLDDLERKSAEEIANKLDKTEEFNSPADSPFSEGADESSCLSTKIQVSDRVNSNEYTESVNLDRDLAISNSVAFDENSCSQSATTKYNNHLLYGENSADKEYQMDYEDANSVGSESCKPWTEKQIQQQIKTDQNLDINAQDQIVSNSDVVSCDVKTNNKKSLNYGDSALLLPLNLKALSAAVAAGGSSSSKISSDCDLSCVFRTNYHKSFLDDTLSYSAIVEPVHLQQFSDLKREGVYERLKRNGSIDQSAMIEQDEDAVSDVEIKPKITDNILNNNNIDNSGALIPDLDVCVSSGCPEWLDKLSRDEGFREWHEPVVRTSFNHEPLTILPYIVID